MEEASPQTSQFPPQKSFPGKNLKLFQIKISFDDDFKESVKIANVQKCDFRTLYFQNFVGSMPPDPLEGLKIFSRRRVAQKFFQDRLPPRQKVLDRALPTIHLRTDDLT